MTTVAGSVVVGYLDPGKWSACFGLSYRDLCLYDMAGPQRIVRPGGKELRSLTGAGGIPAGRNRLAKDFLDNTDGEYLWVVDSDMGFKPDTVDRLVQSATKNDALVMGGLCFQLKRQAQAEMYGERFRVAPTTFEYIESDDGEVGFRAIADYERDTVMPVAGTGAACLLVHRKALDDVRLKYGDAWFDPLTHPTGNKGEPRTFSEDLSFCVRLQAVDIGVYVDTAVKTTHEKGGVFLDEELFLAQQEGTVTDGVGG